MAHVYRADTVGSLLRPQYLKLAREQFEAGQLAAANMPNAAGVLTLAPPPPPETSA